MSHFSVFRAKALQSPAQPRPAPHRAPAVHETCLLMLNTEPRWYAEPVFQRSTEPGNLFTHFIRMPPYAHPLSMGDISLTPFGCLLMLNTELWRYAEPASLCSLLS